MQDVADKKKEITDDDLLALITDEVNQPVSLWSLLDLQVLTFASQPYCAQAGLLSMLCTATLAQQSVTLIAVSFVDAPPVFSQGARSCHTQMRSGALAFTSGLLTSVF